MNNKDDIFPATGPESGCVRKQPVADYRRKPDWLKIKLPRGFKTSQVIGLLNEKHLHTICSSGMCPNRAE